MRKLIIASMAAAAFSLGACTEKAQDEAAEAGAAVADDVEATGDVVADEAADVASEAGNVVEGTVNAAGDAVEAASDEVAAEVDAAETNDKQ